MLVPSKRSKWRPSICSFGRRSAGFRGSRQPRIRLPRVRSFRRWPRCTGRGSPTSLGSMGRMSVVPRSAIREDPRTDAIPERTSLDRTGWATVRLQQRGPADPSSLVRSRGDREDGQTPKNTSSAALGYSLKQGVDRPVPSEEGTPRCRYGAPPQLRDPIFGRAVLYLTDQHATLVGGVTRRQANG
jgi:hypothetical protein